MLPTVLHLDAYGDYYALWYNYFYYMSRRPEIRFRSFHTDIYRRDMGRIDSNSNRISSREKGIWRLVFCILLFFLTVCLVNPMLQNDTYYIIKLGEQILDKGVDLSDHWAWSAQLVNTYPHFLLNILLAVLYRFFGFTGIYVFVLVFAYFFSLSLYYILERIYEKVIGMTDLSLYPVVGMIVAVIVLLTYPTFMAARSQIFSYLLWLWEAWFIFGFLNSGKKRYAAGIIVIAWLCAMIHATAWYFTFIVFIPFIAAVYFTKLGRFLTSKGIKFDRYLVDDRIVLSNDTECREVNKLWIILLISYATGLLTPTRLCYTSVFKASSGNTVKFITEHKPLVLADVKYVLAGIILIVVLLAFFKVKCRLDLLLLCGGTLYMALNSYRHIGLLVYLGWTALFFLLFGALRLIPLNFRERVKKSVIPVLVIIALAVLGLANNNVLNFRYDDPSIVSDEALDFLKENYDVKELRLFNDYAYGAYMLFEDVPVFIDSRVNEYTKEFDPSLERDVFNDYIAIVSLYDNWQEVVDYYDFDGYYIAKGSALNVFLSTRADVEPVWENDRMIIYMTVRDE